MLLACKYQCDTHRYIISLKENKVRILCIQNFSSFYNFANKKVIAKTVEITRNFRRLLASNDIQGARVAQWVRSLNLTAHTSLSPIRRGFTPSFVNYKKGCTRLAATSDKVYQLLAQGRWFSSRTPASSTTKTGCHDIAEILLKVALNTNSNSILMTSMNACLIQEANGSQLQFFRSQMESLSDRPIYGKS